MKKNRNGLVHAAFALAVCAVYAVHAAAGPTGTVDHTEQGDIKVDLARRVIVAPPPPWRNPWWPIIVPTGENSFTEGTPDGGGAPDDVPGEPAEPCLNC